MKTYNLALIGFGNVNRALAQVIVEGEAELARRYGIRFRVVGISDLFLGSIISPNGIDLRALEGMNLTRGGFANLSGGSADPETRRVICDAPVDIVVEATFTDPIDGEPAVSHCRWAIEAGRHVVTTNKGPVALAAAELKALAARHGVAFEYEGSVMSGTPVLRLAREAIPAVGLTGFQGILNGTSNYVLGRMGDGLSFADAVSEAQAKGYAEADPKADLAGYDVRLKVVILANELLGASITPVDVACEGIEALTPAKIAAAEADGKCWKLIGSAYRREDGRIVAEVAPQTLPLTHPLAAVRGATNAVTFDTAMLGPVSIIGAGAGRVETAYALLADIIAIDRDRGVSNAQAAA